MVDSEESVEESSGSESVVGDPEEDGERREVVEAEDVEGPERIDKVV